MAKILGIDLGTTNSCVAVVEGGSPDVIANKEGARTTPSVIAISADETQEVLVGMSAKNQMVTNPEQTFYSVKRLIGLRFDDPAVQKEKKLLPFEIRKSDKGGVEIQFGDNWLAPEAISAKVLAKLKADAEAFLGETIKEAVITVPAYFDDAQRQATKNAGKIAGFDVKRIINEPTAAAIAYGLNEGSEKTIVVYDLGGGTFDVSVLEVGDGVVEVKATNGDTHLGGDDFDQALINLLVTEFKNEQGIDLKNDNAALQRLREAAEKAKITLSSAEKTEINLPYITADAKGPKHLRKVLTRSDFEKLVDDLIKRTLEPVRKALSDAKVDKSEVDDVVLVGGMTRMPIIKKTVEEFFGKKPHEGVNPDEVVAVGAAVQGAVLAGDQSVKDVTLLDVTPLSLGIEVNHGQMHVMIPRNTTIPTEKTEDNFTTAADNQTAIDIRILQGERPMSADNKELGTFRLDGIPPAPRGVPRFEVIFKIDANGILHVSAKDKATSKEQKITITASTQMSDDEVDRLVKEAQQHAEEDKAKKEKAEVRNNADTLVFQIEKFVDEMKDKLTEDQKKEMQDGAKELKEMIAKDDFDNAKVKEATDALSKKLQDIGAKMYEQAAKDEKKDEKPEDKKEEGEKSAEEGEVVS